MLYGIQASKDVKLSNISRTLQEPIPLIKTEDRLSRNLFRDDLTGEINEQLQFVIPMGSSLGTPLSSLKGLANSRCFYSLTIR
ncbi:MAG: hypothetical protein WC401_07620 [Bacteroidales bacterium]